MKIHALYQISLKVFLKNERGETLILKAANGGSYEGYYDFPGGRIDQSELDVPLDEIIRRELSEEIGAVQFEVDARPVATGRHFLPSRSGNTAGNHVLYIFFEASYGGGRVVISDEHLDHRWVRLEEEDPAGLFKSGILEGVKMYLDR